MPSRQGIEISYAAEGPWITFYGKDSHVSYNLRWLVRRQIVTGGNTLQKRTLREWLNARHEQEGLDPVNRSTAEPHKPLTSKSRRR